MASYLISFLLLAPLVASASALDESTPKNKDILVAVREMQQASYFTFVMLINMVQDKIPSNTTFLMPSDRMLSKISIPENKVLEFLSWHSIPSPLMFNDLKHFPTGTMIPTYQPGYMIRIYNRGRKRFYLNNVQLISPNICTAGFSFRCHGINGVLKMTTPKRSPPADCSHIAPPATAAEPSSAPFLSPSAPLVSPPSVDPAVSPPPAEFDDRPRKSSSPNLHFRRLSTAIVSCAVLAMMCLPF